MPRPAMLVAMVTAPLRPGLRDDFGFLRVILGVEHDVLRALALQHVRDTLGLFDRHRADQRGTAQLGGLDDVVDDRRPLFGFGAIDEVGFLDAHHLAVGGNGDDVEVVDLGEFRGFRDGGAGHARQLLVLAEIVLEGDGRERLVLALDLDAFLGLDGLVQAVAPAASRHQAAGELVDDDDLAVLDHVLHVELVMDVRAERLLHVVEQRHVRGIVEAARLQPMREQLLGLAPCRFRSASRSCSFRRRRSRPTLRADRDPRP